MLEGKIYVHILFFDIFKFIIKLGNKCWETIILANSHNLVYFLLFHLLYASRLKEWIWISSWADNIYLLFHDSAAKSCILVWKTTMHKLTKTLPGINTLLYFMLINCEVTASILSTTLSLYMVFLFIRCVFVCAKCVCLLAFDKPKPDLSAFNLYTSGF